MADAEARDFEDEDRIAVGLLLSPSADVGRDVADIDVVDDECVPRGTAGGIPAAQHVLDAGSGMSVKCVRCALFMVAMRGVGVLP